MKSHPIVFLHHSLVDSVYRDAEVVHLDVLADDWYSGEDARRVWVEMSPRARKLAREHFRACGMKFNEALFRKVMR